jgi:hypothetical protein
MCVACSTATCQSTNPTYDETIFVVERYGGGIVRRGSTSVGAHRLMPGWVPSWVLKDVWPSDCQDSKLLPVSEFISASLPLRANVSLM